MMPFPLKKFTTVGSPLSPKDGGLPAALKAKFLFLWTGKYDGDNLLSDLDSTVITVTDRDWITIQIPDTIATFNVPANATYLAADGTDDVWFDSSDNLNLLNFLQLIAGNPQRTFVKCTDFEPYLVSVIGILKTGETISEAEEILLTRYFKLWFLYWGEPSEYGYMKDNKLFPAEE